MNMKLLLINHSFQINYYSRRWQLFAEAFPDVEVVLLAPAEYTWYKDKGYSFGFTKKVEAKVIDKDNYHVRLFKRVDHKVIGWSSPDFKRIIVEESPDVIYHIGMHNCASLVQVLSIRNKYLKKAKVVAFSMRGPAMNLKKWKRSYSFLKNMVYLFLYPLRRLMLNFINSNTDAFFCHYPDAVKCFRDEGYTGPIYMQTQVGVNSEWFHEDSVARSKIRNQYHISESTYVFGSATRFSPEKGVDDILSALPVDGDWKYIMMGGGANEEIQRLIDIIEMRGIRDKVIVTGFVDWYDISQYWNAIDCAIHVPRTTDHWEETFSLSIVQPMIIGKPVIGSSSGSVPYQIGDKDLIVEEGNIEGLKEKICWAMNNRDEMLRKGKALQHRTETSFEVKSLNSLFYETLVEDIMTGQYNHLKADMTLYGKQQG